MTALLRYFAKAQSYSNKTLVTSEISAEANSKEEAHTKLLQCNRHGCVISMYSDKEQIEARIRLAEHNRRITSQ